MLEFIRTQQGLQKLLLKRGAKIDGSTPKSSGDLSKLLVSLGFMEAAFELDKLKAFESKRKLEDQNIEKNFIDLKIAFILNQELTKMLIDEVVTQFMREQKMKQFQHEIRDLLTKEAQELDRKRQEALSAQIEQMRAQLLDQIKQINKQNLNQLTNIFNQIQDLKKNIDDIQVQREQTIDYHAKKIVKDLDEIKIDGSNPFAGKSIEEKEKFVKDYLEQTHEEQEELLTHTAHELQLQKEIEELERQKRSQELLLKRQAQEQMQQEALNAQAEEKQNQHELELMQAEEDEVSEEIDDLQHELEEQEMQFEQELHKLGLNKEQEDNIIKAKSPKEVNLAIKGEKIEQLKAILDIRLSKEKKLIEKIAMLEARKQEIQVKRDALASKLIRQAFSKNSSTFVLEFKSRKVFERDDKIKAIDKKLEALRASLANEQADTHIIKERLQKKTSKLVQAHGIGVGASAAAQSAFSDAMAAGAAGAVADLHALSAQEQGYYQQMQDLQQAAKQVQKAANKERAACERSLYDLYNGNYVKSEDAEADEAAIAAMYDQVVAAGAAAREYRVARPPPLP